MATAELAPPPARKQARTKSTEQRFVLSGVTWKSYRAFAEALGEHHVRLSYDGNHLEFMTVSRLHDRLSRLLARLVVVLTEELGLPLDSAGSTTLDREDLGRALEPDECFYIQNEPRIRDRDVIDLATDPPPDLAIEVAISHSSLNRFDIYALLGVPEVWRCDGKVIEVYHLGANRQHVRAENSLSFPQVRPADFAVFLQRRGEQDGNALMSEFRQWVREQIAAGSKKRRRR